MQQALLTGEIEQLTAEARHGLNAEQKQRLAELLVKKTRKQRDVDHET
jgi:hypothetical protein